MGFTRKLRTCHSERSEESILRYTLWLTRLYALASRGTQCRFLAPLGMTYWRAFACILPGLVGLFLRQPVEAAAGDVYQQRNQHYRHEHKRVELEQSQPRKQCQHPKHARQHAENDHHLLLRHPYVQQAMVQMAPVG